MACREQTHTFANLAQRGAASFTLLTPLLQVHSDCSPFQLDRQLDGKPSSSYKPSHRCRRLLSELYSMFRVLRVTSLASRNSPLPRTHPSFTPRQWNHTKSIPNPTRRSWGQIFARGGAIAAATVGTVYLVDSQFNASAIGRTVRTFYTVRLRPLASPRFTA